ncbi:MAG: hypothetical protein IJW31_00780 [Lentisphaeria bacterium]|nr:hypothetical protein [Lentisphaeria bacterium]
MKFHALFFWILRFALNDVVSLYHGGRMKTRHAERDDYHAKHPAYFLWSKAPHLILMQIHTIFSGFFGK